MIIRTMNIADYHEVYRLWTETQGMGMRSMDDSQCGIVKFISRNPSTNFVAEHQNRLVGVILCGHDGRRGYIYHAAVHGEYRHRGIGKALVTEVLKALENEQINKVALVAYKTNETGNHFWSSMGFTVRDDLVYRNLSINSDNV